jgi:hypothetical protein
MAVRNKVYSGTAGTSTTVIAVIPTGENGVQRLGLQILNGGVALTVLDIAVRVGQSAIWSTLASLAADYTDATVKDPMIRCLPSAGLPALAGGATAFVLINCYGIHEVRVLAGVAAGTSLVTVYTTVG